MMYSISLVAYVRHIVRLILLELQYEYNFVVAIFVHLTTTTLPVIVDKSGDVSSFFLKYPSRYSAGIQFGPFLCRRHVVALILQYVTADKDC